MPISDIANPEPAEIQENGVAEARRLAFQQLFRIPGAVVREEALRLAADMGLAVLPVPPPALDSAAGGALR